jgi:hypothetical protein
MTWGLGYGLGQGAEALEPVDNPAAVVGAEAPLTFDFSDEPDGPWPFPAWEFFVVQNDAGEVTGEAEPDRDQYFTVRDGYGWWHYRRNPLVGDPFDRRGYLAAPAGLVTSDNVEAVLVFRAPPSVLDIGQAQLFAEFAVGVRGDTDLSEFVGGRARAEWDAGVWTLPLAVEAIQGAGADPTVLSAVPTPLDLPDQIDIWNASQGDAELRVTVRGTELAVEFNGVLQVTATVPRGGRKLGVFARLELVDGTGQRTTIPAVRSLSVRSLRDFDNLGPPESLPGVQALEAPQLESQMDLPLREWLELGYVTRLEARAFRVARDLDADILGRRYRFGVGDVIRAVEPYKGQELTKSILDLHVLRVEGNA